MCDRQESRTDTLRQQDRAMHMRRADKNRLKGHFYFLYIIKTANEQERFTNIGSRCRRRGKAKSLPKKNEEQSTERTTEINYMWTCV